MKNKNIIIRTGILIFLFSYESVMLSQNLEKLSRQKRDQILTEIAKNVVIKYGSGYYREKCKPVILAKKMSKKDADYGKTDCGRKFYTVYYPYDKKKEQLTLDYLGSADLITRH